MLITSPRHQWGILRSMLNIPRLSWESLESTETQLAIRVKWYYEAHLGFDLSIQVVFFVDDGWFNQPHLAESDWTLGLNEAAHLLHIA